MTTNNNDTLNTLVDQMMDAYQERESARNRKAEEEKRQQEEKTEQELRHLLEEFLSAEFRGSIQFSYKHTYENKYHSIEARFPYLQSDWILQRLREGWSIRVSKPGNFYGTTKDSGILDQYLQARLLIEMGKYRKNFLENQEQEQRQLKAQQQYLKEREEAEAQALREQQARAEQAEAEHQRLAALLAEEEAKVARSMWHWPKGTTIELYEMRWQTGSHGEREDEDEEEGQQSAAVSFDYESGWTATSHLDHRGRIKIEAHRSPYGNHAKEGRTIQLSFSIHRPIWTVHTISSMEDLPKALTLDVVVSLPHIVERYNTDLGRYCLVEVEKLEFEDEEWVDKTIGHVPMPWIRALADDVADGN